MKNFILTTLSAFLIFTVTANCLLADANTTPTPQTNQYLCLNNNFSEKIFLPLEDMEYKRFKLVHKANDPGTKMWVQEWVPKEQDLNDWNEMISISYTRSKSHNVNEFEKNLKRSIAVMYYGSEYDLYIIRKTKDEYFYMLEVPNGHKDIPRFYTINRVIFTPKGVHSVVYEKRESDFKKSDQMLWAERLNEASLRSD